MIKYKQVILKYIVLLLSFIQTQIRLVNKSISIYDEFFKKHIMKHLTTTKRQPLLVDDSHSEITDYQDDPHIYNSYTEYLLSMIGFAVGFGSFWRFPYLIYKNGGGVFLIPYFIALFVLGIPLLYLETAIGQMHRKSVPFVFSKINKGLKFLGMTYLFSCLHMAGYYNIIMTYSYRLIFSAFIPDLPFIHQSPAENHYFSEEILHKSSSINQFGQIQPSLLILYIVSIMVCYFIVRKGVKTSGKIVTFTALAPYFFFIVLLIRAITLEGAFEGVTYLFHPKWQKLFSLNIWVDAAVQVFFQFNIAISGIVNLSSMKPKRQRILSGIYIIPTSLVLCGMLCALNVFMYLGHFTNELGISIDQLALSGPQLSFNIFPKALAILPFPNLWIFMFFVSMVFLGIDSEFAFFESIYCYLKDQFKQGEIQIFGIGIDLEKAKKLVIFCILIFCPTLTSSAGIYYLQFYDTFVATIPFSLGVLIQLYFFVYVFKFEQMQKRIQKYTKQECPRWIRRLLQGKILLIILLCNLGIACVNQFFCFFQYSFKFYLFGWLITAYPYVIAYIYYIRNKQPKFNLTFAEVQERHSHL